MLVDNNISYLQATFNKFMKYIYRRILDMVKINNSKKVVVTEKTKKVKGIYGNYGVRQVGNKIHTRIRKTINNEPKDFCGKGITLELAVADL